MLFVRRTMHVLAGHEGTEHQTSGNGISKMKYLVSMAQLTLVYTVMVHLDTVQSLCLPYSTFEFHNKVKPFIIKPAKYFIAQKLFYCIYLVFDVDAPSFHALVQYI